MIELIQLGSPSLTAVLQVWVIHIILLEYQRFAALVADLDNQLR